jgi:UDP-N-acetylglucosamine 2-epimerase (non-hydrolysing)
LKVLVVIGTRPEAIKLAPVVRELFKHRNSIDCRLCLTGQHREMVEQALSLFGIRPDYELGVMTDNQKLSEVAAAILLRIQPLLEREEPDWVLVQGDTTTVAAASLAACYNRVKLAHVEAGLRTYDKEHPFPEEINRRTTAALADLHLAPTDQARQNLLQEGVSPDRIVLTGNPIVDAVQWATTLPFETSRLPAPLATHPARKLVLITAHRRESFGEPFENICLAMRDLAERYRDDVNFVYPVHPNPKVHEPANRILGKTTNITLTPPLDYLTFLNLVRRAYLVLTDSGGVQEEAGTLGVPVVILRQRTERSELVELGIGKVVGFNRSAIVDEVSLLLDCEFEHRQMVRQLHPYGDGKASARIVSALLRTGELMAPEPALPPEVALAG